MNEAGYWEQKLSTGRGIAAQQWMQKTGTSTASLVPCTYPCHSWTKELCGDRAGSKPTCRSPARLLKQYRQRVILLLRPFSRPSYRPVILSQGWQGYNRDQHEGALNPGTSQKALPHPTASDRHPDFPICSVPMRFISIRNYISKHIRACSRKLVF